MKCFVLAVAILVGTPGNVSWAQSDPLTTYRIFEIGMVLGQWSVLKNMPIPSACKEKAIQTEVAYLMLEELIKKNTKSPKSKVAEDYTAFNQLLLGYAACRDKEAK